MESIRTGLRNIIGDLLRGRPAEEAALLAWPLVCGKDVAARTRAAAFTDGCLTVEVSDSTWAAQLKSFAPTYVNGFQSLLGGPLVKEVKFKVSR
jgi:predicted nucleic acid-binding Zn ribbon protein